MPIHANVSANNLKIDPRIVQMVNQEDQIIIAAVRAFVEADVSIKPNTLLYTVHETKGDFAQVGVGSPEGGAYYIIAKKVHGTWAALFGAQGLPGKELGQKYGLPSDWYSTEY